MRQRNAVLTIAALFAAGLTLAACDEAEQGRVRHYEPGKYQGKADTELTAEQREALRRRTMGQSGS